MMTAASCSCGVVSVVERRAAAPVPKFPDFGAGRHSICFFLSFYPLLPVFARVDPIAVPRRRNQDGIDFMNLFTRLCLILLECEKRP